MPVTITKKSDDVKPAEVPLVQPDAQTEEQNDMALTVDLWVAKTAELERRLDALVPLQDTIKELWTKIAASIENEDPEATPVVKGNAFKIEFGQKANSTEITDMDKAVELLGTETFMKVAKIGLGDLRAYLTPEELNECTKTERVGGRSKKVKPTVDPKEAKKSKK